MPAVSPLVNPDNPTCWPAVQAPAAVTVTVEPVWLVAVTGTATPAAFAYEALPLATASVPL